MRRRGLRRARGVWLASVGSGLIGCGVPVRVVGGRDLPSGRWMNLEVGHHRWVIPLAARQQLWVEADWPGAVGEVQLHLGTVQVEADEPDGDEAIAKSDIPILRLAQGRRAGELALAPGANAGLIEVDGSGTDALPLRLRLEWR